MAKYSNYPLKYQVRDLRAKIDLIMSEKASNNKLANNLQHMDMFNIAMKCFKWENLPEELKRRERLIERFLCERGAVAMFYDETKGFYILPFSYVGAVDDYGEYTRIQPISMNSNTVFKEYTIGEDCVIIRDNELEIAPILYINYHADKIEKLFRIREKNNNFLKMPIIFGSTGNRGEDKKNAFEVSQVLGADDNEIAIVSGAFDQLKLFDLKPQYFGRELQEQIKDLQNNFFEYLGIKFNSEYKKERMSVEEVNMAEERCMVHLKKRLDPREKACEQINKIWGLDLRVIANKFDEDIVKTTNVVASVSGGVHNDNARQQQKSDRK